MEKYTRDLLQKFLVSSCGSDNIINTTTTTTQTQQTQNAQHHHHQHGEREDPPAPSYHTLVRVPSLPTETEEEWQKRKELQTLRRMEAKRQRSEKQKVSRSERDVAAGGCGGGSEEAEGGGGTMGLNRCDSSTLPFGLPSWSMATTTKQVIILGDVLGKGKIGVGFQGLFAQPSSQGSSADSQGGSFPSVSEMDSKPFLRRERAVGVKGEN